MKPYSESCEQNRAPILEVLQQHFASATRVLEIGSGTGQHAVYFAADLPHLNWQTSDRPENHPGIHLWLQEASLPNVMPPLDLDVLGDWPGQTFDALYSANTAHIMSWSMAEAMMAGAGQVLESGGVFCLYGPFNYNGQFTSESNARFEQWLKDRNPESGIKDFEKLNQWAEEAGMRLVEDVEMPANNRTLVWTRI